MSHCLISFGSNLGERIELIRAAAKAIRQHPRVQALRCSRLYETPPVGGPGGQEPFLNAVAVLHTDLSTDEVLLLLQEIENGLGRVREQRWGRRCIDLDVVLYGDFLGNTFRLKLPHLRYTARTFVLAPAQDVAADWIDPRFGWSLGELYAHIRHAPASLALVGGGRELRKEICEQAAAKYGLLYCESAQPELHADVIGHAPVFIGEKIARSAEQGDMSPLDATKPWISDFVPEAIHGADPAVATLDPRMPRLIARLQQKNPEGMWPPPGVIYRNGWNWPEYQLEVDDVPWAIGEVGAAIESMRCAVSPVSADGSWSE